MMISRMCDNATIAVCTKEIAAFNDTVANNNGNNLPIIKVLKSKTYFVQFKFSMWCGTDGWFLFCLIAS